MPGSGTSPVGVSGVAASLSANTEYHFRIVARNAGGTSYGSDQAFSTLPNPPTVVTGSASSVMQASATVNASVNPGGAPAGVCEFEYGTTTAYGSSAPCTPAPGSGNAPVSVSAWLVGLLSNTTYHFRIVATNAGGTSHGSDGTFSTLPNPPTAVTSAASSVTQTSAMLNGSVNPNEVTVADCHFDYGPTTSYGTTLPCASLPGSGGTPVAVSALVTGLNPNTVYHFRVVAVDAEGTSYGLDESLTTPPNPPTVLTGSASAVTTTSATLNATVNPNGATVSDCHLDYGPTSAFGTSAQCAVYPGSGTAPVGVSASIGSLSFNTVYHYRVVAANSAGTSYGLEQTFTTGGPPEFGRCLPVAPEHVGGRTIYHGGFTAPTCVVKSATSSGKYEWTSGVTHGHFVTTGGAVTLETVATVAVRCTAESGSGEVAGPKALQNVSMKFTGCERLGQKCTTAGAVSGELKTSNLEGTLGWEVKALKKVALALYPPGKAGTFVEYECGPGATVKVEGSLLVPVTSGQMLGSTTLKFLAPGGKQSVDHFARGPLAILEAATNGEEPEQAGVAGTLTQAGDEAVEINPVV